MISSIKRRGVLLALVILPNGSQSVHAAAWRAAMQLNLAFLDPPQPPPTRPPPATWEQFDEAARLAALGVLARLIARMLAAAPAKENDHE